MSIVVRLERVGLDPRAELSDMFEQSTDDGAVVSFVGIARSDEGKVERLVLEHHEALTSKSLEEIATAAADQFGVSHIRVVHRCGEVAPGEAIVFAAAASTHRRAAFEAADYLMDRLKTEAVLWKREEGPAGSTWVEPSEADYGERERWK